MDSKNYTNPYDFRFSTDYFSQVPTSPGVFWFLDSKRNVLIVEATSNLRFQLLQFKRQKSSSQDEMNEAIHQVRQIEWNQTASISQARKLKQKLDQALRPTFKSKSSWKLLANETADKIVVGHSEKSPDFYHNFEMEISDSKKVVASKWVPSLCRWIWMLRNPTSLTEVPPRLLKKSPNLFFEIPTQSFWKPSTPFAKCLERFVLGYSDLFLVYGEQVLYEHLEKDLDVGFYRQIFLDDRENLFRFFHQTVQTRDIQSPIFRPQQRGYEFING